ncbi:uncharacterized protein B0H64DRAFT_379386 [Chaetomium fimeti]|uniref:Uncharacterized protein n=1 Tax=Chaetomium fimeti TaxID=1854472 RepID=A0AAE0LW94_9PEZI|nr:hypothetical protein B0H64DRAFT_379386 [Chaetomium fimeti]
MVSNKKRLYIALYPSGVARNDERKYHWGFLTGPKIEDEEEVPGTRYHVKNHPIQGWVYEERHVTNVQSTVTLLARILIAKIEDERRLVASFRNTPVVQADPNWRCRAWVRAVLASIKRDGRAVGTSNLSWAEIEPLARDYVAKKAESGRYGVSQIENMNQPKPTWDMLEDKEIVP